MSTPRYIGAIDQGTTGTRFMLFDRDGAVQASAYEEHRQICPQPGWVEHDPVEIWNKTQQVIRTCLERADITPDQIAGLGITNQRETTCAWNPRTGEPYYNALVWQDTRTRDICQELEQQKVGDKVQQKTGLVVSTYFSGTKIRWLLENVEGLREKMRRGEVLFGTIDAWLIWNLTGGKHITDCSNASRTLLMDLHTLSWDTELRDFFGVSEQALPQIRPTSDPEFYGRTTQGGVFGAEIPVCGSLGDQQAALFGQACFNVGDAKNTYGTGCFLLVNTGNEVVRSGSGLLTTVAYSTEKGKAVYALEGSIAVTGAAVQWLRDNLQIITDAAETESIAASVTDTGDIYFVPAFSGLFAPYWDMNARGAIVGLTQYVTKAHLVRATLESICYQTRDVIEAVNADLGTDRTSLKVDGGAVVNDLLMQIQADILGIPCVRPVVHETTALGAAYAAGLAVGYWENLDSLRTHWQVDRIFESQWSEERRHTACAGWKKAIDRTRNWVT